MPHKHVFKQRWAWREERQAWWNVCDYCGREFYKHQPKTDNPNK